MELTPITSECFGGIMSEAKYLDSQGEGVVSIEEQAQEMWNTYADNKTLPVGSNIFCPVCGKFFLKKTYQMSFCRNKGHRNCKDVFWNTVDDKRRQRVGMF